VAPLQLCLVRECFELIWSLESLTESTYQFSVTLPPLETSHMALGTRNSTPYDIALDKVPQKLGASVLG